MRTQRMLRLLFIVSVALLLVSCSAPKEKIETAETEKDEVEEDVIEQQIASPEANSREAVFVYKNQEVQNVEKVTLKLKAEPLLLPNGYVRLVGVVSGSEPLALIEVGGRGFSVAIGQEVGKYLVTGISKNGVQLRKGEN